MYILQRKQGLVRGAQGLADAFLGMVHTQPKIAWYIQSAQGTTMPLEQHVLVCLPP